MCARGITDPEEARRFLYEELPLHDPLLMKDMDKAVARLALALKGRDESSLPSRPTGLLFACPRDLLSVPMVSPAPMTAASAAEDGRPECYELEFCWNGNQYEYEVDCYTGPGPDDGRLRSRGARCDKSPTPG